MKATLLQTATCITTPKSLNFVMIMQCTGLSGIMLFRWLFSHFCCDSLAALTGEVHYQRIANTSLFLHSLHKLTCEFSVQRASSFEPFSVFCITIAMKILSVHDSVQTRQHDRVFYTIFGKFMACFCKGTMEKQAINFLRTTPEIL